jgi:hypothetical protein
MTISVRAAIRPALERVIVALRERRYPIDVAMLRVLRNFGLECYELGVRSAAAHTAHTVPAPKRDDER